MHIGIIGTGYVGLVTGACFADLDKKNLRNIRLNFSTKVKDAVESLFVIFIAVGTPPRGDGTADMRHVEEVASEIAREIKTAS